MNKIPLFDWFGNVAGYFVPAGIGCGPLFLLIIIAMGPVILPWVGLWAVKKGQERIKLGERGMIYLQLIFAWAVTLGGFALYAIFLYAYIANPCKCWR